MSEEASERQRFGRYETLFRIAGGGMAEVYAARSLGEAGFQKLVALKRMRPELAEDARFVTMFLDEGRLAANIASPNVVSTLDLGRADDNSLYLVMELLTGVALSQLIEQTLARGTPIPIPIGVDIVAQAASGLHDAHEAKSPTGEALEIVHRDCSPHNILVDVNGQVKITDFGIAKAMERQTQSHAGEMKGKLCYLSPEQAHGLPVDRRTDIFILGIVCWEVLARRMLFDAENAVAALHKVASMPIPRLDEVNPEVSADLAAAVAQALARDPNERYSTAAAFGNALLEALRTRPPPRSELGAFVRRFGGPDLAHVETRIRDTMIAERDGLSERPPSLAPAPASASEPTHPPTRTEPEAARREIASTVEAPAPDLGDASVAAALASSAPPPRSEPPRAIAPTREAMAPRRRLATEPLELTPARARNRTQSLEPEAPPVPARAPRRAPLVALGAVLVVLAGAGGAFAAWWSTRPPEIAAPEAVAPEAVAPEVVAPAPIEAAARPVEAPTAPVEPTAVATEPPEPTAIAPLETVEADPSPRAARRAPRRTPHETSRPTGDAPPTVRGAVTPRGDRAATFDEIPWQ